MEHAETSRTLKTRREATTKIGHAASQLITPGCRDPPPAHADRPSKGQQFTAISRGNAQIEMLNAEDAKLKCGTAK